jgi:hypothetical protein
MTIPTFDYDAAFASTPSLWRDEGLHWHGYTWRGPGRDFADDRLRHDAASEVTPSIVRDWLKKNPRLIRATFTTPEQAAEWLREQWEPVVRDALYPVPDWMKGDSRYQCAIHEMAAGGDISWGLWVKGQSMVSMSVVGTPDGCH